MVKVSKQPINLSKKFSFFAFCGTLIKYMSLGTFARSKQKQLSTNQPKVYFTDYCEVCKVEGVFLLDNKCSNCLEDLTNPFAKQRRELCEPAPKAFIRPNPNIPAIKFTRLLD